MIARRSPSIRDGSGTDRAHYEYVLNCTHSFAVRDDHAQSDDLIFCNRFGIPDVEAADALTKDYLGLKHYMGAGCPIEYSDERNQGDLANVTRLHD